MEDPQRLLEDIVRTGLSTFKSTVEGITAVLRTGDSAIRDLDSALTGKPASAPAIESPDQSFMEVVALAQAAMQEAREHGSANADAVVQRAREILSKVNRAEPAWRPGPHIVRTANDVFRVALRDLRASANLLRLAQGQGSLDDLEALTKWADDVSQRMDVTRQVVAQPKPKAIEASQVIDVTPEPAVGSNPTPAVAAAPTGKKRSTRPKKRAGQKEIAFAMAVAEETGDAKIKGWAQEFADGKISEKQWLSRLTSYAGNKFDPDEIFTRASERMKSGQ